MNSILQRSSVTYSCLPKQVRNTHFIVYWYVEGNADLHKGDVIAPGVVTVTSVCDYSCSTSNSSFRTGVSGARPRRDRADTTLVNSKILIFMLWLQLIECYIINCTGILKINILCVYLYRMINDLWNLL